MGDKAYIVTSLISGNAGVSVTLSSTEGGEEQNYLIKRQTMKRLEIRNGSVIGEEIVSELYDDAELGRAEARMVRILSYSDHSCQALVRKLESFGFSKEIAERAAKIAVEQGYINESEQAARYADYCIRHKYWGKKRIAMELMSRGYGREAVSEAVASIDEELFSATLEKLIEKKYPEPADSQGEYDRRVSAMSRMGYSLSEIKKAMEALYRNQP